MIDDLGAADDARGVDADEYADWLTGVGGDRRHLVGQQHIAEQIR